MTALRNDFLDPGRQRLEDMYARMLLIRGVEEQLGEWFKAGELPAGVHLYIGQEASGVGVCEHLADDDWITSTHRGHGHFLAKGGDPRAMMAEIQARGDGVCGGYGGTMHVADISRGILGANGIVGAGIGIATGAAFAAQLEKRGRVAVCFFGDGAANQGVLMEALNVASLWKLPLVLVCENNGWSEFSATATVTSGNLGDRARAFGVPVETVDGNDVAAVWRAAGTAIAHARSGGGPTFLETMTYRTRGHVEAEVNFLSEAYRTQDEVDGWRARDPLDRARALLTQAGANEGDLDAIAARVGSQVAQAAAAATTGPEPDPSRVPTMMFAEQEA